MSNCTYYSDRSVAYYDTAKILWATGNYALANYHYGRSDAYEDSWMHCTGFR